MKKALSLLLAMVMVLSLIPMTAFAATTPRIYFETDFTTDMGVGDTFTVVGKLEDNEIFGGMCLSLKWNENAVKFNGFNTDSRGALVTEVFTYTAPIINNELGIIVASDAYGFDTNGVMFTANFEIVSESGELGIGLKDGNIEEFMVIDENGKQMDVIVDLSSLNGLTVGGKPVGPEMPEDAPFSAITTDAGAIIDIEQLDDLEVDPWGVGGTPTAYYHVIVPAGTTEAYIKFNIAKADFQYETREGTNYPSGAYASNDSYEGGMTSFTYGESGEDYTFIVIPMEITTSSWGGTPEMLSLIMDEEGFCYAAGPQYASDSSTIAVFSFEYAADGGEEEEIYSITIDEYIVGGTVTVMDENMIERITEAEEGDYIFLANAPEKGYQFKNYLINDVEVTEATLGMTNGFYQMPAEDINVSAVFVKKEPEIEPNPITEIEISHPNIVIDETTGTMTMNMVAGASEQIDMSFAVSNTELDATQVVTWSTSDESVATVEQSGKITAVGAGSATISAKAVDASGIALLADDEVVLAEFTLTVSDPAVGYTVNMGVDMTVDAGETIQIPVIVGNTEENVVDYKSYEFVFEYDPALLTLVTGSSKDDQKEITVVDNNGTVTVHRYGSALNVDAAAITLEFTAKAVGNTNVKLIAAKVGTSYDAQSQNIPTAQIVDNITRITVNGYTVQLPQDFTGETSGENYIFEAKDKNYTYKVKATIDGEEITVNSNEDGTSFTIPTGVIDGNVVIEIVNKEGKKFEITLDGDSLAHEGGFTTEGEKTYVQYMENYTAKLTKKDHYIYDLKVTVNGETVAYDYNIETGIITIAGNLITGPVVIDSGELESDKHDVTFEGTYASHAKYEGESAVYDGENFSFTIETPEGFTIQSYEVSYKMGDAEEYTTLEANDGTYTVENVTAALTIKIEGTSDLNVEVNEYVKLNGKVVFLVTATQTLPEGKNLAYNGNVMYLKNFQVEGSDTMEQMYSYLVAVGSSETLSVEAAAEKISVVEAEATILEASFNVNESSALDINDAQLVYDLYNNVYQDIDIVGMKKFLRADVNGSRNINVADAAAVVDAILANKQ